MPAEQRTKHILRAGLTGLVVRVAGIFISFATIPGYLSYFESSNEGLAVWFVLLTFLTWALNLDFGLGNGLRQAVVDLRSNGDTLGLKRAISSTYSIAFLLSLLAGTILIFGILTFNWQTLFRGNQEVDLKSALTIITIAICLQLVLRIAPSILYGLHRPTTAAVPGLASNILLLLYLLAATHLPIRGDLDALALAYLVCLTAPLLATSLWLFRALIPEASPSMQFIAFGEGRRILQIGAGFLLLQLLYAAATTTNPAVISWQLEPSAVVEYQVYSRPYSALSMIFGMALIPIWSAVTQAAKDGDLTWVNKLFGRLCGLTLVAALVLIAAIPAMGPFYAIWLRDPELQPSTFQLCCLALSCTALIANAGLSNLANGLGQILSQVSLLAVGIACKFAFTLIVLQQSQEWALVALSDTLAFLPYILIQPLIIIQALRRTAKHNTRSR